MHGYCVFAKFWACRTWETSPLGFLLWEDQSHSQSSTILFSSFPKSLTSNTITSRIRFQMWTLGYDQSSRDEDSLKSMCPSFGTYGCELSTSRICSHPRNLTLRDRHWNLVSARGGTCLQKRNFIYFSWCIGPPWYVRQQTRQWWVDDEARSHLGHSLTLHVSCLLFKHCSHVRTLKVDLRAARPLCPSYQCAHIE